jgi:hypothetical protein
LSITSQIKFKKSKEIFLKKEDFCKIFLIYIGKKMTSSLSHTSLFKIDESSFRGCCSSSKIDPETSVYINKKGEVKKFCWFTTFLWSAKNVEDEQCFLRKRILVLVIEHLKNLYDETRGDVCYQYIYDSFLRRAEIDGETFVEKKDPVTFSLIERIKGALLEASKAIEAYNGFDSNNKVVVNRALIANDSEEEKIEQRHGMLEIRHLRCFQALSLQIFIKNRQNKIS